MIFLFFIIPYLNFSRSQAIRVILVTIMAAAQQKEAHSMCPVWTCSECRAGSKAECHSLCCFCCYLSTCTRQVSFALCVVYLSTCTRQVSFTLCVAYLSTCTRQVSFALCVVVLRRGGNNCKFHFFYVNVIPKRPHARHTWQF